VPYFPVFLEITGRPVVVFGGATGEAVRKVNGLLDAGAEVTLVNPKLHPDIQPLVDEGRIRHIDRTYEPGDLEGYTIAFVGTDNTKQNAAVSKEGRERGIMVNAVDDIPHCDFIMPGIIRRGQLTVAISTDGGSPAMARKVREDLEAFLTEDDGLLLDLAAEVRREFRESNTHIPSCKRCGRSSNDVWNAALDGEVKRLLAEGQRDKAKERLTRLLLAPAESA
jgi:precorrin-2 dehydrogenase/sirohydrochlorin ferrochelatase